MYYCSKEVESGEEKQGDGTRSKRKGGKLLSTAGCVVLYISTVKLKVKFSHPILFPLST